jgi:hypothetical protein
MKGPLEDCDLALFRRDGFVIKRRWFDAEEMEALARFAREDPELVSHHLAVKDAVGRESRRSSSWATRSTTITPR